MKSRRRKRGPRQRAEGLGDFITREARQLHRLRDLLNGPWATPERAALCAQVIAVIEALAARRYPVIPPKAGELFAAFAEGLTFRYEVRALPSTAVVFQSPVPNSEEGIAAFELFQLLRNRYRARLRRCQQCGIWFIDTSRNNSALRCSRQCTIAWSNRQRKPQGSER